MPCPGLAATVPVPRIPPLPPSARDQFRRARARAASAKPLAKVPLARKDPLRFLEELVKEQGDVARVPLGLRRDLVVLTRPEHNFELLVKQNSAFQGLGLARPLLDDGLLGVDGAEHLRQRSQMKPAFHHERIKAYAALTSAASAQWGAKWQDGQRVDMADEMMRLTLEVTGLAIFGPDHARDAQAIGEALTVSLAAFRRSPFAPWTSKWPTYTGARFRLARSRLDALVEAHVAQRRALPTLRHDMLAMLMDAEDPNGDRMTDKEVRDQLLTLLVAGHETTALSPPRSWHGLAQNQHVQEKLHAEVDRVLAGKLPGVEDVPKLPYTRMVLTEAMRVWPPVWSVGRHVIAPADLAGVQVKPKDIVVISPYITHHDPRWWPNPETFDPERFAKGDKEFRHKMSYVPFGGGPRVCLGEQLAWMEGILLIATLAQRWRVKPAPGSVVERQPLLTLQPRGGLPLVVEARRA
jgi:cytochrome P450